MKQLYIETENGIEVLLRPTLPDGTKSTGYCFVSIKDYKKWEVIFQHLAVIYGEIKGLAVKNKKKPLGKCFKELKEYALTKIPAVDDKELLLTVSAYLWGWLSRDLESKYGKKDHHVTNHVIVMEKLFNIKSLPDADDSLTFWAYILPWHALWITRFDEITDYWITSFARIDKYVAQWEADHRPDIEEKFWRTPSARHYRDLQDALCKKLFGPMQGTPWPTALLATGKDYAQLIPPPFEAQLLPPEEAEQWAALMFKQQKELSDLDADALDALSSIWLSQAGNPQDDAVADIDLLLSMRGLIPKHKGRGRAFRKEQRREMLRALHHIQNIWLNIAEAETKEKGKKIRQAIQSRAFVITDRMGQMRFDGFMDVQRFIFRPGSIFASYLFGHGRQIALLSRKALEYDFYRHKWEKRLTRYLSWHWRTQAYRGKFLMSYRVETLLDVVGEQIKKGFPQRTKERLEKALDQLQEDKIIAGWQYNNWNEDTMGKRGWAQAYLKTTLSVEAPDSIKEYYRENLRQLRPKKAPQALPPPAPIDGLAQLLRTERRRRKVTQLQLAERLGIDDSYISQIENSQVTPSAKVQEKIRTWLTQES